MTTSYPFGIIMSMSTALPPRSRDLRAARHQARVAAALSILTDQEVAVIASALDAASTAVHAPDAPMQDDLAVATLDRLRAAASRDDMRRALAARSGI